jgi:hypothetical protein
MCSTVVDTSPAVVEYQEGYCQPVVGIDNASNQDSFVAADRS